MLNEIDLSEWARIIGLNVTRGLRQTCLFPARFRGRRSGFTKTDFALPMPGHVLSVRGEASPDLCRNFEQSDWEIPARFQVSATLDWCL
uniref:Uncharacterized protein n=1 Tax=Candidatus Kentrum sp. FW TaxID=2126338 RepID=A0A450TWR3_9GAMM|nr:MAG: hypothetical protein BECKFW1821C_GA0114237_10526 [Candidatus Kentron sp. FW]